MDGQEGNEVNEPERDRMEGDAKGLKKILKGNLLIGYPTRLFSKGGKGRLVAALSVQRLCVA